jgi:hypothetical protein
VARVHVFSEEFVVKFEDGAERGFKYILIYLASRTSSHETTASTKRAMLKRDVSGASDLRSRSLATDYGIVDIYSPDIEM